MGTNTKIFMGLIILLYIILYCCIYNSYVIFSVADTMKLNPEYRCVDMIDSDYCHAYVHVVGCDIFLNPFREYGSTYRVYNTSDEFISSKSNWGQLYVPMFDKFITVF